MEDPIQGIGSGLVESVSRRVEGSNRTNASATGLVTWDYSLSVHQVQGINLCGSVTMSSDILDVSKQRSILVPVIKLFFGICDQLNSGPGGCNWSLQSGSSYLAGTL